MKKIIFLPFLFSLSVVLSLFSFNVNQVSINEIYYPFLIIIIIVALLLLLINLIFRDYNKASIITFIFLFIFFSFGHIESIITGWEIGGFVIGRKRYLLFISALIIVLSLFLIRNTKRDFDKIASYLIFVFGSSIVISIIKIGYYNYQTFGNYNYDSGINLDIESESQNFPNKLPLRDIYYIILDGYANSRTLNKLYSYNNNNFYNKLISKNFYVTSKSYSNYFLSHLSLASILNMEYINYFTDKLGKLSQDTKLPYKMIKDNKVVSFLKSKGYKFIHFSSGWGPTNSNELADLDINTSGSLGNEFLLVLYQTTMMYAFENYLGLVRNNERKRRLGVFSELGNLNIRGPKFVFSHIMSPHPPYLFDAKGEPMPDPLIELKGSIWGLRENYLNQLIFLNSKVEIMIDEILDNSNVPPIIIIQSDHGPASTFVDLNTGDNWDLNWKKPSDSMLNERAGILNAFYLPSIDYSILYDSISPVNTFRLIFNLYFNTSFELIPDVSYFSNEFSPYNFININDKIKH